MSEQELSVEEIVGRLNAYDGGKGWRGLSNWSQRSRNFLHARADFRQPVELNIEDARAIVQGWADAALLDWLEKRWRNRKTMLDWDGAQEMEYRVSQGTPIREAIQTAMNKEQGAK